MIVKLRISLAALAGLCLAARGFIASAATPTQDPDWPCQQRLVPELTAAGYWTGAAIPKGIDWRSNPRVAGLVEEVTPRDVPVDAGTAKIRAFVETTKHEGEGGLLPAAFAGILDETNRQRDEIIARLKDLMRRQRGIAEQIAKANDEANAIPADAKGEDADRRAEALGRQAFLTRTFDETRRTMQYACEVPTQLDARLGAYARALQNMP